MRDKTMKNIILAFPKPENGKRIKSILQQNGFEVSAVCTTGAKALQYANEFSGGILICGWRFLDMVYSELYECLPPGFEMLLVASAEHCETREYREIVCLHMPLRIHELIQTLNMMADSLPGGKRHAKKAKRSREEEILIQSAKELLMERNNMTEEEAHKYLQKRSMDNGTGLLETAQMVLSLMKS